MFRLSELVREVEEWMNEWTYAYSIKDVFRYNADKYMIQIIEKGPDGSVDKYWISVYTDGRMLNYTDDMITIAKSAYENDEMIMDWIRKFEERWYKAA